MITPIVKPGKGAPLRIYWNLAHWGFGYLSVILAIINIFLGFTVLVSTHGMGVLGHSVLSSVHVGYSCAPFSCR